MNKKIFTPSFFTLLALIVVATLSRFFPHPANFTPVLAIALFAGAYFNQKYVAFIVPMVVLFVSDLFLGLHASMWGVYTAMLIAILIGSALKNRIRISSVLLASLSASVVFFLLSNFAVWTGGWCGYPMTTSGFILCYEMALPFFRNELLGTLVFSGVLFGAYQLLAVKFPVLSSK